MNARSSTGQCDVARFGGPRGQHLDLDGCLELPLWYGCQHTTYLTFNINIRFGCPPRHGCLVDFRGRLHFTPTCMHCRDCRITWQSLPVTPSPLFPLFSFNILHAMSSTRPTFLLSIGYSTRFWSQTASIFFIAACPIWCPFVESIQTIIDSFSSLSTTISAGLYFLAFIWSLHWSSWR